MKGNWKRLSTYYVLAGNKFVALTSSRLIKNLDVSFPQDGPNSGAGITRTGPSSFNLADIGSYQVLFNVGVHLHQ